MEKQILHTRTVQIEGSEAVYMVTAVQNRIMVERMFNDQTTVISGTLGVADGIKIVDKIASLLGQ